MRGKGFLGGWGRDMASLETVSTFIWIVVLATESAADCEIHKQRCSKIFGCQSRMRTVEMRCETPEFTPDGDQVPGYFCMDGCKKELKKLRKYEAGRCVLHLAMEDSSSSCFPVNRRTRACYQELVGSNNTAIHCSPHPHRICLNFFDCKEIILLPVEKICSEAFRKLDDEVFCSADCSAFLDLAEGLAPQGVFYAIGLRTCCCSLDPNCVGFVEMRERFQTRCLHPGRNSLARFKALPREANRWQSAVSPPSPLTASSANIIISHFLFAVLSFFLYKLLDAEVDS